MRRVISFISLIILFNQSSKGQTGSWNILNVKVDLNDRWNFFGEAQIRSLKLYDDFHYYELKGGFTYAISKTFSASTGFGIFDTYSPGGNFKSPMVNDEFRSWLQISMQQYEKRLKFEHRYRAEQRFTNNGFRNRFRYRLSSIYPLNKAKVEPKTLFLNISDEIFFTDKAPYFERNRLFLGLGYELSESFSIQSGYLKQFDYRINDETGKNFFQIAFLIELNPLKKIKQRIPGSMN